MGLQHNFSFNILLFLAANDFVLCTYSLESVRSDQEPRHESCLPRSCGIGPSISYPFFVSSNGTDFCGRPGFGIQCQGGSPIYRTSSGASYIIQNIDYQNQTFLLVDTQVMINSTCPTPLQNYSFDQSSLEFMPNHAGIFFFFNCSNSLTVSVNFPKSSVSCDDYSFQASNETNTFIALVPLSYADLNWTTSACESVVPAPIQLDSAEITQTIADIDYKKKLKDGFTLKWVGLEYDCEACQRSGGRCGFDTDRSTCYCPDGSSQANSCSHVAHLGNGKLGSGAILALGVSGAVLGALMFIAFIFRKSIISGLIFFCWRKIRAENSSIEDFLKHYGPLAPKRYTYSEVKKITKSFKEKLGRGGYGEMFKGNLADGSLVAVKILEKSKTNGEDFINEGASIGRTSHVNIVTLMGFCFEGSKRALIYEFMSGGSLEKYIYKENCSKDDHQLDWETLLEIATGIARGLEYLHRGCNTRILHFDIKPHNIFLDEKLCPKISDFVLAKICPERESIISMAGTRGTAGYIDPEVFCRTFGGVSHKSDVYSYGMLVFEMVGGRKNTRVGAENTSDIYFPDWIYKRLELGEELGLRWTENEEERQIARKMNLVSLWCIRTNPSDRPPMSKVVEMLQGSLEFTPIPPKPHWSSPSRSVQLSVTNSTSTSILTG